MTGQSPLTGQRLVDSVTGDQSTDSHPETDIDVRVHSQPCFLRREAGVKALASRPQETRHANALRRTFPLTANAETRREAWADALLTSFLRQALEQLRLKCRVVKDPHVKHCGLY